MNFRCFKGINFGLLFFRIGVFLLPTTFAISAVFLLLSSAIGFKKKGSNYFRDIWNLPLLIISILMIISSINSKFFQTSFTSYEKWDPNLSLLDLANWIPHFFIFWSLGIYVSSTKLRRESAFLLLSGSVPILISGFCQLFTNFHGPFEILNGLITWYQRPLKDNQGISAIFSNANYLGCWLTIIWPFSLAFFISEKNKNYNKIIILLLIILIGFSIALTKSRSSWGSLILSLPLLLGWGSLLWLVPFILMISIILIFTIIPINEEINLLFQSIVSKGSWDEFSSDEFINSARELRINIWLYALNLISTSPFLGFSAGLFPILYLYNYNNWIGHTHNIFLEIAFNYGIITSLILILFFISILYKSQKIIEQNNFKSSTKKINIYNRAWWVSSFLILFSQLVDIQYYEGRISVILWILFSGLRSIISENEQTVS